jgi:hypothetical protein
MKLAIMQPYFFPYIGYFQLIAASDVLVLHDDVQYIKGGWVNRNRILLNGEDRMITLPVRKDSYDLPINARNYLEDKQARRDIINLVKQAYAKAPCYREIFPLIEELLMFADGNVARYNENLIRRICDLIGIQSRIINSSGMDKDDRLIGEARVLEICKRLGATDYTNPQGGQTLYDTAMFRDAGINLRFLFMRAKPYPQKAAGFIPHLSIIDALMELGSESIRPYLAEYDLLATPAEPERAGAC